MVCDGAAHQEGGLLIEPDAEQLGPGVKHVDELVLGA